MAIIGYYHDKPKYRKTILCLFGIHKPTRYVFVRENGKDYFICRKCGKRYKVM